MSTKQPSHRRETPKRMQGITQPNKTRTTVLSNWDAIRDGLPKPCDVWRWGEVDLSHRCLYNLKEMGLIERAGVEKYWRTTQTLWRYVQEASLPGEDVGTVVRWDPEDNRSEDDREPLMDPAAASQRSLTGWAARFS